MEFGVVIPTRFGGSWSAPQIVLVLEREAKKGAVR